MKQRFKARKAAFISDQQANAYGMELFRLMKSQKRDSILPKEIVKDAKNPKKAYHDYFEWDNKVCGGKWREQQARVLIDSLEEVTFSKTGKPLSVRSFLNVNVDGQNTYVPQAVVFQQVTLSGQIVANALRELNGWTSRYETYSELSGLCSGVGVVVDSWKKTNPA